MTRRRRSDANAGYTLIELIIVVSLLMVVLVPILMTLLRANTGSTDLRKNTEARATTRQAVDTLVRDFRQAQTRVQGMSHVEAVSPTSVTFYSPDKTVIAATDIGFFKLRRITYEIVGTTLTRQVTTSTNQAPPWTFPATAGPTLVVATNLKPYSTTAASRSYFRAFSATGVDVTSAPTMVSEVRRLFLHFEVNALPRTSSLQIFEDTVEMRSEPIH
jgi:type II secretory pathway pseudopilin PulG